MTKSEEINIKYLYVDELIPYINNSRTHTSEQVEQVASSIKEFGFINPVIIDGNNGIIAGHCRVLASKKLGLEKVPCIEVGYLTEAQRKAYVIADNKLALNADWDDDLLRIELEGLRDLDFDLELTGFSLDEIDELLNLDDGEESEESRKGNLSDKFLIPPFSVLNSRDGWWQDRKRSWLKLGIKSENGRGDDLTFSKNLLNSDKYKNVNSLSATSIFDPVLCELAYKWFTPNNALVLDPFAGGSVRGVVASKLGRKYIGCELREEQVNENRIQGEEICSGEDNVPVWINTDSRLIDKVCGDVKADFIFTCPPYADLEVYSDDPRDISTLNYPEFREVYFDIINKSCSLLKDNRFACIVVSEVRDKKGNYYNFVSDTIEAFKKAGLDYYNEAILVNCVGTLAIRCGRFFEAGRKLGRTHQNVLVFVKGDSKKATEACGEIEVHFPKEDDDLV